MAAPVKLPRGVVLHRGRYRVRVDYEGRTHSLGVYDTLTDARAALDIARGQMARGLFVPPNERRAARQAEAVKAEAQAVTLREWSSCWLAALEANPDRSRATVVSYRSVLKNHVLDDLGDIRLADLTTQRVADHLAAIGRQRSRRHPGSRVNGVAPNVVIVLRSMLNSAVKAHAGGLEAFEFPSAPKHRRVRPEDEHGELALPQEVKAFAEAMPAHLQIAVPLAAWCALRLGEVLGLQRRDLDHLDNAEMAVLHVRRQWNVKANALTPPKADSARSIAACGAPARADASPRGAHTLAAHGSRSRQQPRCQGLPERFGSRLEEREGAGGPPGIPLPRPAAHGPEQVRGAGSDVG